MRTGSTLQFCCKPVRRTGKQSRRFVTNVSPKKKSRDTNITVFPNLTRMRLFKYVIPQTSRGAKSRSKTQRVHGCCLIKIAPPLLIKAATGYLSPLISSGQSSCPIPSPPCHGQLLIWRPERKKGLAKTTTPPSQNDPQIGLAPLACLAWHIEYDWEKPLIHRQGDGGKHLEPCALHVGKLVS